MRVFVSSVIRGYERYRDAAAEAVESLGYSVVRAEDFGARTETPQQACLEAARESDLTVVLLGARYGEPQDSGLSPTHEEFREARDHGAVAVFIEQDIEPVPPQQEFIREAREWTTGHQTGSFKTPDELRSKVTRIVHKHALRQEAGEVEPEDLAERARALLPSRASRSSSRLYVVVTCGPRREVLPPSRSSDRDFIKAVKQRALFGPEELFASSEGTKDRQVDDGIVFEQRDRSIHVTSEGSVRVALPAVRRDRDARSGLPVLIEENLREDLASALGFAGWVLEEIDPVHRLSELLAMAAIEGGGALGWKTRAEHAACPNRVSHSLHQAELVVVPADPPSRRRPAIRAARDEIAADLTARLRREMKP